MSASRRKFIQQTSLVGAGLMLPNPLGMFAQEPQRAPKNIKSRGYAARNKDVGLEPWNFERRALTDNDVLIEIKYASICHSDIHLMKGHWGEQTYPQVPGHEIAGIVTAVGKNVTKFKVGDKAGVGCMVNSCMKCDSCKKGEENHCESGMVNTYGSVEASSPTGITQGGYSNNIVVKEHFAFKIPAEVDLRYAAPLLCAGITTYSPLMKANLKKGDKVGVAGIGGLGHLAIKLAVSKGAEVYAFTTSPAKADDIRSFGAKEVIVVDDISKLKAWNGKLDFMISTVPYAYDLSSYLSCVKPYGYFTQVGVPINGDLSINAFTMVTSRVNFNGSLIGGIAQTQELLDYCFQNKIFPQVQVISAEKINEAWEKVVNKQARYRFVIDATTF